MPSYQQIVGKLKVDELEEFELKSSSRRYNGYTLFTRHYYHHKRMEDKGIKHLIENMKYLETGVGQHDDSSLSMSSSSSGSISSASTSTSNPNQQDIKKMRFGIA